MVQIILVCRIIANFVFRPVNNSATQLHSEVMLRVCHTHNIHESHHITIRKLCGRY